MWTSIQASILCYNIFKQMLYFDMIHYAQQMLLSKIYKPFSPPSL